MASIRKSFSFRNGVQVDEDNFIVNANGLGRYWNFNT